MSHLILTDCSELQLSNFNVPPEPHQVQDSEVGYHPSWGQDALLGQHGPTAHGNDKGNPPANDGPIVAIHQDSVHARHVHKGVSPGLHGRSPSHPGK